MGGRASAASKNKWMSKAYDRINLTVPKGRKSTIEALVKQRGESVNGYINGLIRADMGLSEDEWRKKEEE